MAPQKLNPDCYCKMDADPADEVEKDKEAIVAVRILQYGSFWLTRVFILC
jgi:hypothetical protein